YMTVFDRHPLVLRPQRTLKCFTCTGQLTNANCLTATACTNGETAVATATLNTAINKMCASSCTPSSSSNGIASISCCTTDLCNYRGGASIRSSCAAIILALGSILKSSVL
ncbi:hypothetical protein GDO78_019572, partial [Eleutherodactylus coqui]